MTGPAVHIDPFSTSAALSVLDGLVLKLGDAALPSARSAWEAAWIACLGNGVTWALKAEQEFSRVLTELQARVRPIADGTPAT